MKKQLLISYLIIVITSILVIGVLVSYLEQNLYKEETINKLHNILILSDQSLMIQKEAKLRTDFNVEATRLASSLVLSEEEKNLSEHIRVTFINLKGVVIGESQTDFKKMENHANRKEFIQALSGGVGTDIRNSKTLMIDFIYVAMKLKSYETVLRVSVPMTHIRGLNNMIWIYLLFGVGAGILLTLILGYQFSLRITYPVKKLIEATKEIESGKYNQRVSIESKDELGQLGENFNMMAEKLEGTVEELVDKNLKFDAIMNSIVNAIIAVDSNFKIILANKVSRTLFNISIKEELLGKNFPEVIRNNQILNLLTDTIENNSSIVKEIVIGVNDEKTLRIYSNPISGGAVPVTKGGIILVQDITEIRKLEQIRTEFVSNVTHELKTPLTSIRGFVETLRNGAIEDTVVSGKFLEIIDIEAERLYMLINDILQLSEIEHRQSDYNISKNNLKLIAEEVISILEGLAAKKNVSLELVCPQDVFMEVNRDRLKQMFINLIENAVKYNVDKGKVTIEIIKTLDSINISVEDTGIGIPKEHLTRVFERFYRVDKGRSRSMGGTGLGLSIVKHIVNLYNGDIKVVSNLEKGTSFSLRFPYNHP